MSSTVTISGQVVLFFGQKPASQPCAFLVSKLAHTAASKDDIGTWSIVQHNIWTNTTYIYLISNIYSQ
jgi:hypothetical protein